MTKIIVGIALTVFIALVFGFGITEALIVEPPPDGGEWNWSRKRTNINRGHAYIVCALVVFACAVPIGLGGVPFFPQHHEPFNRIFYAFVIIFIPAAIGVWCALPQKVKD